MHAQQSKTFYKEQLGLSEAQAPPEDILSASSLVLFSVSKDVEQNEWKNKLIELQTFFESQGIDAIAYLDIATLFSRPGAISALPQALVNRQVSNLILFHYQGDKKSLFLGIGPYGGGNNFWTKEAPFWMRTSTDIQSIFAELDTYFKTGARTRTNLLVNEYPEIFFPDTMSQEILLEAKPNISDGYRVALRSWADDFGGQAGPQKFLSENLIDPQAFRNKWAERQQLFNELANDTTNIINFVERDLSDEQLLRSTYEYELAAYYGSHLELKSFFKTKTPLPFFEGRRIVFYMKSLASNTLYLPVGWQPEEDWAMALEYIMNAFKDELYLQKVD